MDIEMLLAPQQDVRAYAGNSICSLIILQVNVENWLRKSFSALLHCPEKNLKNSVSCRTDTLEKVI